MTYEFLAEAKAEFWEAAERYESKEAGFLMRAQNAVRVELFPSSIFHPQSSLVAALPRCDIL